MVAMVEERLLDRVSYGFQGGPTYLTERAQLRSGGVIRNSVRERPIYRYTAPYEAIRPEDHAIVIAAFNACRGSGVSFRFKDWADYTVTNEFVAVGTGAVQTVELFKRYSLGALVTERRIKKLVAGTVSLSSAGSVSGVSFDLNEGTVTFTGDSGVPVYWSGQFDVPVFFSNDELIFNFENFDALTANVQLEEDTLV